VYGFAVPGIDNAGHIGGAVTGLVIALAFAIAYRQRLAATLKHLPSRAQDIYQTTYINSPRFDNEGNFDNKSSFNHDSAVNLPLDSYANHAPLNHGKINEQQTVTKSTLIWPLLPWLVMLLISIGFVWWWQDIHQQILQVLAAIE
ncbi:hypothetical protein, partial [Klebsiella pneumoniae]|uniref:hypothetical protein n=1 Tax=Klebsiella pneumoniae TaxID=573 RepID=UPI0019D70F8C